MIIYKATNTINNNCYIGNTYFHNSIRKYGWENFKWKILCKNIDNESKLNAMEKFYIAAYRSMGYKLYNLTNGGEGTSGLIPSEETRKKLSKSKIGNKNNSPKFGINNPFYGKKHSEKSKKKISKANKGRVRTAKSIEKMKKVVINLDTGKIFNSIQNASDFYNIDRSSIGRVCNNERKTAGGYMWRFKCLQFQLHNN